MITPADAAVGDVTTIIPGVHGWIISTLIFVVVTLSGVIVWMQKRADKVYSYRLQERDTLNAALVAAAAAQEAQASASRERNRLQDELTETIAALSQSITLFIERQTIHHTHLVADQAKYIQVIESIAEAMRNAALQSTGVKDRVDALLIQLPGMTKDMIERIDKMVDDVQAAAREAARHAPRGRQ